MKALGWLSLLFAVFFGLGAACGPALTPAEQQEVDQCRLQLAGINADCATRKALCTDTGCEDAIEAECATKIEEACK